MKIKLSKDRNFLLLTELEGLQDNQFSISFKKRIEKVWVNPKVKAKKWDGYFNFYKNSMVPVGLWREFIKVCEKYNYNYNKDFISDIIDTSIKLEDVQNFFNNYFGSNSYMKPRDYQIEAVYKFVKYRRIIAEMATSSGKTFIIYMIYVYLKKLFADKGFNNFKFLMVVPSITLGTQAYDDFLEYFKGDGNGYMPRMLNISGENISHKNEKMEDYDIAIGTFQSLVKKDVSFFRLFNTLMVDECHTANSKSVKGVLSKCINSHFKFGLSGTTGVNSKYAEGFTLQESIGPMLYKITPQQLIENNYAPKVNISIFRLNYLSYKNRKALNNAMKRKGVDKGRIYKLEKDLVVSSKKRLNFLIEHTESLNNNTLILFSSVESGYGKIIYEALRNSSKDFDVMYVDGSVKGDIRDEYKRKMEFGVNKILVASFGTFSTGVSINNLHNIILAESYKSEKIVKQSIGRIMRNHESKNGVYVYDFVDDFRLVNYSLDTPVLESKAENYLYKHGKERMKIYKSDGHPYKVKKIKL